MHLHLLLEDPWPLAIALAVVAAVLRVLAVRHGSRPLTAGALIVATSPLEMAAVDAMVKPGATFGGPDGAIWLRPDQIREALQRVAHQYGIERQKVDEVHVEVQGR